MGTWNKFTDEEDQVIISKVKENPNNLSEAFRKAATEIDRDWKVISQRWYVKNKHQAALRDRCGHCFLLHGSRTLNINRKNVSINTSDNTITISMGKLQKILNILLED